ncbi:hypothetical protein Hanom_Chr01g00046731 [Helianthus anomalus]
MDQEFSRIDIRQDRQDDVLRYMMNRMSMNIPAFFQPYTMPGSFDMPGQFDSGDQGGQS